MDKKYDAVTLESVASGAFEECFQVELTKVLKNIKDINTKDSAREINLKMKLKPSKDRARISISVDVSSKIAPLQSIESTLFITGEKNLKAVEFNPKQGTIDELQGSTNSIGLKAVK